MPARVALAAATGSGTLVVVSGSDLHVLALADGRETWTGPAAPHARRVEGPVIAGGALYVVADGVVVRFEGAGGE